MRKTLALIVSAGLATAALSAPALAGKQKKIEETITVTEAPLPNYSSITGSTSPGCTAEFVVPAGQTPHKAVTPLRVPGEGKLSVDLTGFTGDWDLYVFDAENRVLAESAADQTAGAPMEERLSLKFKKKTDVSLVACNWAGTPQAELHYKLLYSTASR